MAIDPLRNTGGRIIQLRDRPAGAPRGTVATGPATLPGAEPDSAEGARAAAPDGLNVRKALVLARIQKDYYSQAHVRERVIDSLLQFLNEE
jgi:hypothetical protein